MKKFLDAKDLIAMGLFGSKMTLWRAIKEGRFPPGRMVSANRRKWTADEIENYVNACPIARDAEPTSRDNAPSTGEAA